MKKGIYGSYLVIGFVLLAVVLIISSVMLITWKNVYEKTEQSSRCASQIRAHASAVRMTGELKTPEIVCPTERFELTEGQDPERFLAGEMKRCWDMWGRGELQIFGDDEGMYCHVCSTIRTDSEPIEGFPLWLARNKVNGESYYEYFTGSVFGDDITVADREDMAKGVIGTDKPVGVIYYHVKGIDWLNKFKNNHLNPATGTATGASAGAVTGGLLAFGVVSLLSGGTLPLIAGTALGIVGGGAAGGSGGFIAGLTLREDMSHVSSIVVRPLSVEDVKRLGCTYAPVANE